MSQIIMSWSECSIEIGKTGASDAMAASLSPIGTIKDKSTTLEVTDGESLEARASGGKIVGYDEGEGIVRLTTRIIEPDFATLATILDATNDTEAGELKIKSLIVADQYSVEVTPKNVGGVGIKARKCHVKYKEGYSESEGQYGDFTFTFLECADGELYTKFKKTAV